MKKKLLVTASTFPRWEGDTEPRFVLDLAKYMTDEYDVTVLVPAAPRAKEEEVLEGVKVIRYHYFPIHEWETLCYPGAIVPRIKEKKIRVLLVPFLLVSLWFHLFKLLPQYDIVHAHWLIPQGIVQSFFKKPYIVTGHGGDVTSLNKGILRKLKIRCLKKAKHVTVVSEHLKQKVQELVPEIEPSVISMGVDTSKFGKQYYVPNYFEQGDKKVVLFVGRLAEKKGVGYLIEAMKEVDALLVIVGDGPLREKLKEQAKELGDKVKFLGSKTHDELKTIYASADIFVAPSITAKDGDQEGFGLVIIEAMASGLPVVASNSGGITQIIADGENGLLCEEKNIEQLACKINELMKRRDVYEISIHDTACKFDYKFLADKYKDIYSIGCSITRIEEMMKKIALNYVYLSEKHAGGKDQVGLNLLKGFYQQGYSKNIWVICFDYSEEVIKEISPDINIIKIKSKECNSEFAKWLEIFYVNTFIMPKIIKENKFDMIFHLSCNTGMRKYNCKSIVLPHDIKAVSHRKLSGVVKPYYQYILYKLLYYIDFRTNDLIIAISDVDKKEISTYYPMFKNKIFKIYNPIDIICPYQKRTKVGKDIVAINLQFHHKNIITLIKAYELIKEKTSADLILVGNVPERVKYLREYVEEKNLTDRVIFKGFVEEKEKNHILQDSKLYVNPSLYEGFGMTAVEAMIFQVPTLVAQIETNVEVTKGLCLYYSPADSEVELSKMLLVGLENGDINLEEKSKIISEEYNYLTISDKYYKLFLEY